MRMPAPTQMKVDTAGISSRYPAASEVYLGPPMRDNGHMSSLTPLSTIAEVDASTGSATAPRLFLELVRSAPTSPALHSMQGDSGWNVWTLQDYADQVAAAAAVDLNVVGAAFFQEVDHVLEELDVAALVGGDRNALRVLLDCGVHDLPHRAVVAQVDDLGAVRLEDAAHDVDGGIVAVKQAGGRDDRKEGNR